MFMLGNLDLDAAPRIAVPLRDAAPRPAADALRAAGADIVELRIDEFEDQRPGNIAAHAAAYPGIPVIATIRLAAEGGGWTGPPEDRAPLFRAALPHAAALDVELQSGTALEEAAQAARAAGARLIVSHHDFEKTPPEEELRGIVTRARAAGADLVKIAARCASRDDIHVLARLLLGHPGVPMIVIGMGAESRLTRICFPALGSRLTFAAWDRPSAPGQLGLQDTRALLDALYAPPAS